MILRLGLELAIMTQDIGEGLVFSPDLADEVEDTHQDLVQMTILQHTDVVHHHELKDRPGNSDQVFLEVKIPTHLVKPQFSQIVNFSEEQYQPRSILGKWQRRWSNVFIGDRSRS